MKMDDGISNPTTPTPTANPAPVVTPTPSSKPNPAPTPTPAPSTPVVVPDLNPIDALTGLIKSAQSDIQTIKTTIGGIETGVQGLINTGIAAVKNDLIASYNGITASLRNDLESIGKRMSAAETNLVNMAKDVSDAKTFIKNFDTNIKAAVKNAIISGFDDISTAILEIDVTPPSTDGTTNQFEVLWQDM